MVERVHIRIILKQLVDVRVVGTFSGEKQYITLVKLLMREMIRLQQGRGELWTKSLPERAPLKANCSLSAIPTEVWVHVFAYLDGRDLLSAADSCTYWAVILREPTLTMDKLWRPAIQRSLDSVKKKLLAIRNDDGSAAVRLLSQAHESE